MNVIMPVVGEGRRFKEAGYPVLKPFIKLRGRMMIEWALDPIPEDWTVWLICQKKDELTFRNNLPRRTNLALIPVPGPSEGAALTVMAAAPFLDKDEPVAVVNCDQWFRLQGVDLADPSHPPYNALGGTVNFAMDRNWDGFILTFKGEGTRWSYVKSQGDWVREVAEKRVISDQATVGFYWFREAGGLVRGICDMVSANMRTNDEFYLAPVYNELIWRHRHRIKSVPVDEFWGLGTPEDVEKFQQEFTRDKVTELVFKDKQ